MYDTLHTTNKTRMDLSTNFALKSRLAVRCLQCLLVVAAVLLTLVGSCLVGIGISIRLSERFYRPLLSHLDITAIALGVGSISLGILGCCAVFSKRKAIRITFIVSAASGFLAALVVCCWLFLQRNTLLEDSTNSLKITIDNYFVDENYRQLMNDVQQRLHCCGAEFGYGDYGRHPGHDLSAVCEMQFYGQPCSEPLADYLSQKLILVLALTGASGFLLLVVFVLFVVMFCVGGGSRTTINEAN